TTRSRIAAVGRARVAVVTRHRRSPAAHAARARLRRHAGAPVAARLPIRLEAAARRAAVTADRIAVVALLARVDVAVAAPPELPGDHGAGGGRLRLSPDDDHVAGAGDAHGRRRVLDAGIGRAAHGKRRSLKTPVAPEALTPDATGSRRASLDIGLL